MIDLEELLKCIEEKREQLYKVVMGSTHLSSVAVLSVSGELDELLNTYNRLCLDRAGTAKQTRDS